MILFAKDWRKYPTAKPNLKTTNTSFVRLAALYRSMGIKNHAFILALVDQDLVGVDPFDPNLSLEMMGKIALECSINPWFFFREIARAPAIAGIETVPLEANRGNICLFWCFFNHVMVILIQIRQTGKSFSTDILMTYLMNILCQNTAINLLTKDDDLRRKNIQRLKDIAELMPRYLQQKTRDDANNGEEITVKAMGNSYNAHVPQQSPKRAYNLGRGLTSPIFHIDEPPFQPNISISLPASLAATGAAVDRAKAQGTPYGTILTTTAGKKDDRDGKYVFKLLNDAAVWTERFFDCEDIDELYTMIKRNSKGGVVRINATFNHRQLGKDDAWLKEKIDASVAEGEDADRDYFNLWTSGNATHPLAVSLLERMTRSQRDVDYTEITKEGYVVRWYIPEAEIDWRMQNSTFIVGLDPSDAGGGDDIGFVMIDIRTLEVVAAGQYNETNLIHFSKWLVDLFVRYENIVANIERRSSGAAILDYLLIMLPEKDIDPFKRLFNLVVHESDEKRERFKEIQVPMTRRSSDIYVRHKKLFGFVTSGSGMFSRTELYSTTLRNAARTMADKMHDKNLIDQITGLITKNGRIDHEDGSHDDLVIGWLMCMWLLRQGRNLSFYGIDSKLVGADCIEEAEDLTPIDHLQRYEQQQIRQRIEEVYDRLTYEQDEFVCQRLEHELLVLDSRIILEADEIYSVDELIRKAQENRQGKKRASVSSYQHNQNFAQQQVGYHSGGAWYNQGQFSDRPMGAGEMFSQYR